MFHDSGISADMELDMDIPLSVRNSNTLSKDALSLIPGCTMGDILPTSGKVSLDSIPSLALIQARLALMVLISPLWQSLLNGCASFHIGTVLVLNLEWTMAMDDSNSGSDRSR